MGSKGMAVGIIMVLIMVLFNTVSSDFEQDRTECANQLVGLAPCLPYVGGTGKTPTLDCCSGLKQVLQKSKKCLCVLIKDRNNPDLGLKINATLAATLPSSCNVPANVTECIDLLHLAPNSPDAKVFAGFANLTASSSSTPTVGSGGNSTGGGTSTEEKNGGEIAERSKRVGMEIICGFFIWVLISFCI